MPTNSTNSNSRAYKDSDSNLPNPASSTSKALKSKDSGGLNSDAGVDSNSSNFTSDIDSEFNSNFIPESGISKTVEGVDLNNQEKLFEDNLSESEKSSGQKKSDGHYGHYFLGDLLKGNNLVRIDKENRGVNLNKSHSEQKLNGYKNTANQVLVKPLGKQIGSRDSLYYSFDNQNKERDLRERDIRIKGLEKFYKGREYWNWVLSFGIGVSIIFQMSIVYLLAASDTTRVNLSEYKELLYIIAGENFVQIIGLALIAVKFYFADIKKESENRIP